MWCETTMIELGLKGQYSLYLIVGSAQQNHCGCYVVLLPRFLDREKEFPYHAFLNS